MFLQLVFFSLLSFGSIDQSDALFSKRTDFKVDSNELKNLFQKSKEALLKDTSPEQPYDRYWRLARIDYYLSTFGMEQGSEKDRIAVYQEGFDYASKAIALNPKRVEGHFWHAINLGRFAEFKGFPKNMIVLNQLLKSIRNAQSLDATYEGGGPNRVMAKIKMELPRLFGGSTTESRNLLEQAIRSPEGKNYAMNYIALAEVSQKENKLDEAIHYYKEALKLINSGVNNFETEALFNREQIQKKISELAAPKDKAKPPTKEVARR